MRPRTLFRCVCRSIPAALEAAHALRATTWALMAAWISTNAPTLSTSATCALPATISTAGTTARLARPDIQVLGERAAWTLMSALRLLANMAGHATLVTTVTNAHARRAGLGTAARNGYRATGTKTAAPTPLPALRPALERSTASAPAASNSLQMASVASMSTSALCRPPSRLAQRRTWMHAQWLTYRRRMSRPVSKLAKAQASVSTLQR